MHTSKTVYSYEIEHQNGHTVITAQQWPWAVLQVVPTTSATFDAIVAQCKEREGFVATHGTDRTFCIIQLSSGDQGGKYPDRRRHGNILMPCKTRWHRLPHGITPIL